VRVGGYDERRVFKKGASCEETRQILFVSADGGRRERGRDRGGLLLRTVGIAFLAIENIESKIKTLKDGGGGERQQ